MPSRRTPIALLAVTLAAGLVFAACGPSVQMSPSASPAASSGPSADASTGTPPASVAPPGSVPPSPSASPTPLPGASGSAGPASSGSAVGGLPSVPPEFHADPALEATLPSTFEGQPLLRFSLSGELLLANEDSATSKTFAEMVTELGASPDDISFAIATEGTADSRFTVGGLRIAGADGTRMLALYRAATLGDDPDARANEMQIGGRPVIRIVKPGDSVPETYIYVVGDTLYLVQAEADLAEMLLPLLP
jgi:hypothetical protein